MYDKASNRSNYSKSPSIILTLFYSFKNLAIRKLNIYREKKDKTRSAPFLFVPHFEKEKKQLYTL